MNGCPDDQTLAAYVEHTGGDRAAIEEHLDVCDACRRTVAHLAALAVDADAKRLAGGATQTVPMADRAGPTVPDQVPLFGPPLPRGTRVDKYVVEGELGRGGMGIVLSAHDSQLARTVALKIVRPGAQDASSRARLLREARSMARLAHPNVVAIHDVGELDDDRVFLAMEYVRGTTLRGVLAKEKPSLARVLAILIEAGRGLAAAHAAGLIHRDFKPENVLVGEDGRVRVTDFGLARGAEGMGPPSSRAGGGSHTAPPSGVSVAGSLVGTPAYMAPEQLALAPATAAVDQFAFAVTAFEGLTGTRPFPDASFEELVQARRDGTRRPWPVKPVVVAALRAIVDRGLSADPEKRFPSMAEMLSRLEAVERAGSRGRFRAIASAGVVAVGLALAFAVVSRARERAPSASGTQALAAVPCVDGKSAIAAIWNDTKRAEVRTSLSAGASVPSAVDEALAVLDGQAEAWARTHDASCAATRTGTQSVAVFQLRAACLRRRWNEMVETVSVLAEGKVDPDDAFLGDPLGAVRACDDVRTLSALDPLPTDPAERAHVYDVFARIAHARAASGGRWIDTRAIVAEANDVPWAPVPAEAALLGAELGAEPPMADAVRQAEAARDDELAARARRADARKALPRGAGAFTELAGALAAATRLERPDLRADVLEMRATSEAQFGRFAAAMATANEARSLREGGAASPARPPASWTIDLALLQAEAAIEQEDGPAAHTYLAELEATDAADVRATRLVLAARLDVAEGHPDRALRRLDEAEALLTPSLLHAPLMAKTRPRRAAFRAQRARYGALWARSVAMLAEGHDADAQRQLAKTLATLVAEGYGLEPFVQVRTVAVLHRLEHGHGSPARALARAKRAFEIVAPMEPSPIVVEALVALGEAQTDAGDGAAAVTSVTRAEVLSRDASARLRVSCACALLRAARAKGAPASAWPRAVDLGRRALDESSKETPGHDDLMALLARAR